MPTLYIGPGSVPSALSAASGEPAEVNPLAWPILGIGRDTNAATKPGA